MPPPLTQVMHQSEPGNGYSLLRWGSILLRPELVRHGEGCNTLEAAALIYAAAMDGPMATKALDVCLTALREGSVPPASPGTVSAVSLTPASVAGEGEEPP